MRTEKMGQRRRTISEVWDLVKLRKYKAISGHKNSRKIIIRTKKGTSVWVKNKKFSFVTLSLEPCDTLVSLSKR